jgi:hypothetical protein
MNYIIREQIPCYVDFYREVEAESEEEAMAKDVQGDYDYLGHVVGDSVGCLEPTAHGIVDSVPENIHWRHEA